MPVEFHLDIVDFVSGESCVAFHLRVVLDSSSEPVVDGSVLLETVIFLSLYNLGQDFEVFVVALIGDLQSNNLGIAFSRFGDLLVNKTGTLAGLDADTVEVFVEKFHTFLGITGYTVIGFV